MTDKDEIVRLRAYSLWIEEGRPEGREREHWDRARRETELQLSAPDREIDGHTTPGKAMAKAARTPAKKDSGSRDKAAAPGGKAAPEKPAARGVKSATPKPASRTRKT